jgi:hypothetical protein
VVYCVREDSTWFSAFQVKCKWFTACVKTRSQMQVVYCVPSQVQVVYCVREDSTWFSAFDVQCKWFSACVKTRRGFLRSKSSASGFLRGGDLWRSHLPDLWEKTEKMVKSPNRSLTRYGFGYGAYMRLVRSTCLRWCARWSAVTRAHFVDFAIFL